MSLRDLADAINNADGGVRASIINDGTATGAHRLVLTPEAEMEGSQPDSVVRQALDKVAHRREAP